MILQTSCLSYGKMYHAKRNRIAYYKGERHTLEDKGSHRAGNRTKNNWKENIKHRRGYFVVTVEASFVRKSVTEELMSRDKLALTPP